MHVNRSFEGWRRSFLIAATLTVYAVAFCQSATSADWPQILGPERNGISTEETVTAKKAASLWDAKCGSGLAGVAVKSGIAVLFHRENDLETLTAYESATGKVLWSRGLPCDYRAQIVNDNGPRAVPTISCDRIFAYGVQGRLYCANLKTGEFLWTRDTHSDFRAPEGYFGAGSSPLVVDSRVIVNVGGPQGAGVVAFERDTGKTLWKSTDDLASYSSPVYTDRSGSPLLMLITRLHFVGLAPETGDERFRIPFGSRGPTVNGAIPVQLGDQVLLTASYGIGARLLNVDARSAEVVWDDEILSSQYATPIVHQGMVYGVDGRQDGGPVTLKCFDPQTRKVHWSESGLEYGTLVATSDHLLFMQADGLLRVLELTPQSYRELWTQQLLRGTTRALPALADGRWFVRNETTLQAFDLRAMR